jgi:hypothetical protein
MRILRRWLAAFLFSSQECDTRSCPWLAVSVSYLTVTRNCQGTPAIPPLPLPQGPWHRYSGRSENISWFKVASIRCRSNNVGTKGANKVFKLKPFISILFIGYRITSYWSMQWAMMGNVSEKLASTAGHARCSVSDLPPLAHLGLGNCGRQ